MSARAWRGFDEVLIHKVQEFPCLYNYKLKEFRNHATKQNAWRKIAEELGSEDNHCQRRWRLIRDSYVRYKKAQENALGISFVKREENPVMDSLSFLDAFVKHRNVKAELMLDDTNCAAECDEGFGQEQMGASFSIDSDNDNESLGSNGAQFPAFVDGNLAAITCRPEYFLASKRKREDASGVSNQMLLSAFMSGEVPRVEEELECFVRSVFGTLHRFTPKQRAVAKVRIQQLLFEVEFGENNPVPLLVSKQTLENASF